MKNQSWGNHGFPKHDIPAKDMQASYDDLKNNRQYYVYSALDTASHIKEWNFSGNWFWNENTCFMHTCASDCLKMSFRKS